MICKNCGAEINDDSAFCKYCGEKTGNPETIFNTPFPNNKKAYVPEEQLNTTLWIILGVVSALFCCTIGGIVTTVYAAKASGSEKAGDYYEAEDNLKKAKNWFIATVIVGIVTFFIGAMTY